MFYMKISYINEANKLFITLIKNFSYKSNCYSLINMSNQQLEIRSVQEYLLCINYSIIYQLPFGNDPKAVANQTCRILTGKCLLKQNLLFEQTQARVRDRSIIDQATHHIW